MHHKRKRCRAHDRPKRYYEERPEAERRSAEPPDPPHVQHVKGGKRASLSKIHQLEKNLQAAIDKKAERKKKGKKWLLAWSDWEIKSCMKKLKAAKDSRGMT